MWEAREKTLWQNLRHEIGGVMARARQDRRFLPRDISRLLLGGHRTRTLVTRVLARFRPRTPGFLASLEARRLADQLTDRGYSDPLGLITPDQAAEIFAWFKDKPYRDPWRSHLGAFRYPTIPARESNQAYYDIQTILDAPYLLDLANHPLVLETAELILGCKPLLENLSCGWYFAGRDTEKGFQRYHRDFDTPRFFKLFLYLTDTDERSGAHVYVKGSQRSNRLRLLRYIGNDEVAVAYGEDSVAAICGSAGTCFLVDTYGVHKGGLPAVAGAPRLAFAAQYNIWSSPFTPKTPPMKRPHPRFDPYINRGYLHD